MSNDNSFRDLTDRELLERLVTKVDALDTKVGALDTKVDALDTKVNALDAKIDEKVDALDAKIDEKVTGLRNEIIETIRETVGHLNTAIKASEDRIRKEVREARRINRLQYVELVREQEDLA